MGGSAGKIISPVARGLGDVATFGTNELLGNPIGNGTNKLLGGNGSGYGSGSIYGNFFGGNGQSNPYVSGPFTLDPYQLAADQAGIKNLGDTQDAQNQQFITQDASSRSSSRDALAQALTRQAQASFQQGLPQTEETLNAQHLLNGSGLVQELARQQGYLATNIANQMGTQGALDLNRTSDLKQQALQSLQGFGQSGLGRQLSLEDFINQANVAKTIGAQAAPQVGSGKGQTGTLLSGVGALAPLAKVGMGAGKAGPAAAVVP